MTSSRSFVAATDEALTQLISSANQRLVMLAPGVSKAVGAALAERWKQLGPGAVMITLDVDAEVYRLGYGDEAALESLELVGAAIGGVLNRQPGIRVGVLIADDQVLVFAPIPALVSAGPRSESAPNAVLLGSPPSNLKDDLGIGSSGAAAQTIGLDKATLKDIADVHASLERNPPQKFDIARRLRVFNAAFQFVELEMKGTSFGRMMVRIPNHLLGVADEATRKELRTAMKIVPTGHNLGGDDPDRLRRDLARSFLKPITGYGQALLGSKKKDFEVQVELLRDRVKAFATATKAALDIELAKRVAELEKALLPRLIETPPSEWLLPPENPARNEAIKAKLHMELERAVGRADSYVGDMGVTVVYKDVTFESLSSEDFLVNARKAFPELLQLHDEYVAAEAVDSPSNEPCEAG